MEKLIDRLLDFFVRSIAPSSFFILLFFINDFYFNNSELCLIIIENIKKLKDIDSNLLYIILIIFALSYGYINQIFSQILDNFIKRDYVLFFSCNLNTELENLRNHINCNLTNAEKEIFKSLEFNDYNLYQVIGSSIKNNRQYVDFVKTIHTFVFAIIINLIIYILFFDGNFKLLLLIPLVLISGHYFSVSRYFARNKRMYINYLLNKEKKELKESE